MNCSNCGKNKNIYEYRKNRKTCKKCEYVVRKEYSKKYRNDNREMINQRRRITGKLKNWYYKPRPKKPKIIIDKNKVRTLIEKDINLNLELIFIL